MSYTQDYIRYRQVLKDLKYARRIGDRDWAKKLQSELRELSARLDGKRSP